MIHLLQINNIIISNIGQIQTHKYLNLITALAVRMKKATFTPQNILNSEMIINEAKSQGITESIPPKTENQAIVGMLSVHMRLIYLNVRERKIVYKFNLWGRDSDKPLLMQCENGQEIGKGSFKLNIRCSQEMLSKYLYDMKILCVQCVSIMEKVDTNINYQEKNIRNNNQQFVENKIIGHVFINLRRFFIHSTFNPFQDNFNVVDHKKQKIGEIILGIEVKMYNHPTNNKNLDQKLSNQNYAFTSISQRLPSKKQVPILKKSEIQIQKFQSQNVMDIMTDKKVKSNKKVQNFDEIKQDNSNNSIENDINNLNQVYRQNISEKRYFRRPNSQDNYFQEYLKSKPQHSDLSLIRQKYGNNNPSIEIMKLRLDEAKLLTFQTNFNQQNLIDLNNLKNSKEQNSNTTIQLLLKSIQSLVGKNKIDQLTIIYTSNLQKIKTMTKIILPENNQNNIVINYLYLINHPQEKDIITFQTKQAKVEVPLLELINKKHVIGLKNKITFKRVIDLQYCLINSNKRKENKKEDREDKHRKQKSKDKQNDSQKSKDKQNDIDILSKKRNIYIEVLNVGQNKVSLKNKEIGVVKSNKIIYQSKNFSQNNHLAIELEIENTIKTIDYIITNHLYKEDYYEVGQKLSNYNQIIKIVSSSGQLSEVLNVIQHMNQLRLNSQENINAPKQYQFSQKPRDQHISDLVKVVVDLYAAMDMSENQSCKAAIQNALSNPTKYISKLISTLSQISNCQVSQVTSVFRNVFSNRVSGFYQGFQAFHHWNYRYMLIQKSLYKKLLKTRIKYALLMDNLKKCIKKVKSSNKVLFGLIESSYLQDQLVKSLLFEINQEQINEAELEEELQEIKQVISLIIHIFNRYRSNNIKISEIQSFCSMTKFTNQLDLNQYLLKKIQKEMPTVSVEKITQNDLILMKLFQQEEQQQQMNDEEQNNKNFTNILLEEQIEYNNKMMNDEVSNSQLSNNGEKIYTIQSEQQKHANQKIKSQESHYKKIYTEDVQEIKRQEELLLDQDEPSKIVRKKDYKQITIIFREIKFIVLSEKLNIKNIKQISLESQYNKNIIIYSQRQCKSILKLPLALNLIQKDVNTITIILKQHEEGTDLLKYEGVFISNRNLNKIKLYSNGVESANIVVKFQNFKEEDEIQIQVNKKMIQGSVSQRECCNEQRQCQNMLLQESMIEQKHIRNIARSSIIKIYIGEITPSKASYNLSLRDNSTNKIIRSHINYPQQCIFYAQNNTNSSQQYALILSDNKKQLEEVIFRNQLGLENYYFYNKLEKGNKIQYMVNIEVQECWQDAHAINYSDGLAINQHSDGLAINQHSDGLAINQHGTYDENERIVRIFHMKNIFSLEELSKGEYQVSMEHSNQIYLIKKISIKKETRILDVGCSIKMQQKMSSKRKSLMDEYRIKIIHVEKRYLLAEFKMTMATQFKMTVPTKENRSNIKYSQRCLISCCKNNQTQKCNAEQGASNSFRIDLSCYEITYEQTYGCKLDQIIQLFMAESKQIIQQWITSFTKENQIQEQHIVSFLKKHFSLTLSEIAILFSFIQGRNRSEIKEKIQEKVEQEINQTTNQERFIYYFSEKNHKNKQGDQIINLSLNELFKEFAIFDLQNTGLLTNNRYQIIKKMLYKNYIELESLIEQNNDLYQVCRKKEHSSIVDLGIRQNNEKQKEVDYLFLLYKLRQFLDDNFFKSENNNLFLKEEISRNKQNQKKVKKGLYSIKIIQYNKLSINNAPATLLFKINGQKIAQPIPRCYSNKYLEPCPQLRIEVFDKNLQLQICSKKINLDGEWEYVKVEKVQLQEQVKILGGYIKFKIVLTQKIDERKENYSPKKHLLEEEFYENQQIENKDMSKKKQKSSESYWDRAMRQTKQKWEKEKESNKKEIEYDSAEKDYEKLKRIEKLMTISKEDFKKKLSLFDEVDVD